MRRIFKLETGIFMVLTIPDNELRKFSFFNRRQHRKGFFHLFPSQFSYKRLLLRSIYNLTRNYIRQNTNKQQAETHPRSCNILGKNKCTMSVYYAMDKLRYLYKTYIVYALYVISTPNIN